MVCFDTSFAIDFLRGDKTAVLIVTDFDKKGEIMSIASPTLIELVSSAQLGVRREEEKDKIRRFVSSVNVLPLDEGSAFLAGEIEGDLVMSGEKIGDTDVMIGAIAKNNGEGLITRNKNHFSKIDGLRIIDY